MILSQIVRGATESLAESDDLARAFRSASDAAYRAVKKPVEGTMLTAIRSMADAAEHGGGPRGIIARGDDTVAQTRDMLPVLKEAGVVDAGAAGLVEIVRGIHAAITGEALAPPPEHEPELGLEAIHQELSRYRYCTVFVVEGDEPRRRRARGRARAARRLAARRRRHAARSRCTCTPTTPAARSRSAIARGAIGGVEIANMHEQTQQREERLLHSVPTTSEACAVVAVSAGAGNRAPVRELRRGRRRRRPDDEPVDGRPRRGDRARAGGGEVIVLPNNGNVILARRAGGGERVEGRARRADPIAAGGPRGARRVRPVARRRGQRCRRCSEAVDGVATGAVTIASRDVQLNGVAVRKGKWLGLADGEPVAGGDTFDEVAQAVLERLLREPRGVLTLLTGESPPALDGSAREVQRAHPDLELDVHQGGQPHYPLLLAAE